MNLKRSTATEANLGFTLLELTIVLLLIGIIIGGGLITLAASVQAAQFNVTVARIDEIEKALLNFSTAYHRIPCPGDLTLTPASSASGTYYKTISGADYGAEAGSDANSVIAVGTGVCAGTNMTPAANFTSVSYATSTLTSGVAEGAVPVRALGLSDDYMYDGWGRKFSYAVDSSATVAGSIPSMALSCSPITINDSLGNLRSAAAIYALISHGANGHGAYTSNGVPVNAASTNVNEWENCHCNATGASQGYPWGSPVPMTATYVQALPGIATAGSPLTTFDDIVAFKESGQMQTFNNPVTPSFMYIADTSNHRVRKVSASMAGVITTVAGSGTQGYTGDSGPASSAEITSPYRITVDSSGNLYIPDAGNERIRQVMAATGIITTVAGNGTVGYSGDGGQATNSGLYYPPGVAVDNSGNIYIADEDDERIRKVTIATGVITTVAGTGTFGYSGDGAAATSAKIYTPAAVVLDIYGNIYIADSGNNRIRKVTAATGIITTVAGNGTAGYSGDGAAATSAKINEAFGIAVDSSGNLYIADSLNYRLRKVTAATGFISTIAGTGVYGYSGDYGAAANAMLSEPNGVASDIYGNIYIADSYNHRIRKITPSGMICTVVGNGTGGYSGDSGAATSAELNSPFGIAIFSGR